MTIHPTPPTPSQRLQSLRPYLIGALLATLLMSAFVSASEGCHKVRITYDELGLLHGWGSAAAIDKHELLTCAHVVESGRVVEIEVDGEWHKCKVVKVDPENDLALLKADIELPKRLKLAKPDKLTAQGHPMGKSLAKVDGTIREFFSTLDVAPGMSGGPVTNDKGELCGIVRATLADPIARKPLPNTGICVGIGHIREFLGK